MNRRALTVFIALSISFLIPFFGYIYLGSLVAVLFLIGYFGGFLGWLLIPRKLTWQKIKTPYWLAMGAFLFLHKFEENRTKFFRVIGEKITGVAVPEVTPMLAFGLLILPLGLWLLIPYLVKRNSHLGCYLVWTLMASMGITEAAHFIFPFFVEGGYAYFPGMVSATVLVPIGWWGMIRLSQRNV